MNEHKRWETILVHPADSKPYNKSLVKALFIIKESRGLAPSPSLTKCCDEISVMYMMQAFISEVIMICYQLFNFSNILVSAWLFECWIFGYCRRLLTKYHLTAHIIKIYKIRQQTISNLAAVDRSPSFKSSCVDCKILTVVALHSANDWHVGIFAPLVAMLGPPLGPSIDMMSMASTFSSAVAE
ncbi:hypothetical protein NC651_014210 [Populus alba x Populus x berolinensis]|nr:hypothetical protein NC651_014210 [Populus alba x Populus x berolinensis]